MIKRSARGIHGDQKYIFSLRLFGTVTYTHGRMRIKIVLNIYYNRALYHIEKTTVFFVLKVSCRRKDDNLQRKKKTKKKQKKNRYI